MNNAQNSINEFLVGEILALSQLVGEAFLIIGEMGTPEQRRKATIYINNHADTRDRLISKLASDRDAL